MTATMQHPATKPLLDFVEMLQAAGRDTTNVQYESDPNVPGRTAVRITGPTRVGVQAQIDKAMRAAEQEDDCLASSAHFIGPHRMGDGTFAALGEVIIVPRAEAMT